MTPTGQLASRVYVEKKKPKSRLSSFEKVPENLHYLTRKKGDDVTIVTDVIETPRAVLEQFDPEDRHRPVEGVLSGGISGHTGTIGGWVWDETDDTIVMRFRIAFH